MKQTGFDWRESPRWWRIVVTGRTFMLLSFMAFLYIGVRERIWILVVSGAVFTFLNALYVFVAWRKLRSLT